MTQHASGFVALVDAARKRVQEINAADLANALERDPDAALIDVREESEYAAGHVRGAEHIGKGVIERDIEAKHPDRSQPLYLYCGGGYRSVLAAEALQNMGYDNAVSVDGGWRALRELMPIEPESGS